MAFFGNQNVIRVQTVMDAMFRMEILHANKEAKGDDNFMNLSFDDVDEMNSDHSLCYHAGNTKVGHWLFLMSVNMKCKDDNMFNCDSLRNRSNLDAKKDCIRAFSNLGLSVFSAKSAEVWCCPARTTLAKLLLWKLFNRS
jgi:hypothetical protein